MLICILILHNTMSFNLSSSVHFTFVIYNTGTSTLPRTMARSTEVEMTARDKITAATSSASLYDNVNNTNVTPGKTSKAGESKQKEKQNETCQTTPKTANVGIETVTVGSQVNYIVILYNFDK